MTSQFEDFNENISPPEAVIVSFDGPTCGQPELGSKRTVSRLEFKTLGLDAETEIGEAANSKAPVSEATGAVEQPGTEAPLEDGEEIAATIQAAREEAREEARQEYDELLNQKIFEERSRILNADAQFAQQRTSYFAGVENEVVKLSLAIAARILHREVKMDPLLLAGAARMALEKISESDSVVMRVPAVSAEQWCQLLSDFGRGDLKIVADERMVDGDCIIETRVGRVDLGVIAQLEEIERGFFDLLQRRPT